MLSGIGVIGVFTATVASFFVAHEHEPSGPAALEARLDRIEQKLDALLSERDRPRS